MISRARVYELNAKRIKLLHPYVIPYAEKFVKRCEDGGTLVLLTSTLRTFAEQTKLYNQGRTTPGKIVTKAKAGQSHHNFGLAFDFLPLKQKGPDSFSEDWKEESFNKLIPLGISLGLDSGATWTKFKDLPHMELLVGWHWRELSAEGYGTKKSIYDIPMPKPKDKC